jgi:hypothetical protein
MSNAVDKSRSDSSRRMDDRAAEEDRSSFLLPTSYEEIAVTENSESDVPMNGEPMSKVDGQKNNCGSSKRQSYTS